MDPNTIARLTTLMQSATAATESADHAKAAEHYAEAITLTDAGMQRLHAAHAHALLSADRAEDALAAANSALRATQPSPAAWYWKGAALFRMGRRADAKPAFSKAASLERDLTLKTSYMDWAARCDQTDDVDTPTISTPVARADPDAAPATNAASAHAHADSEKANDAVPMESVEPSAPAVPVDNTRMQWYQSISHVNIDVYAKNVNRDGSAVDFSENAMHMRLRRPDKDDYIFDVDLAETIIPAESTWTVSRFKVEVRLKKARRATTWKSLDSASEIISAAVEASVLSRRRLGKTAELQKTWDRVADQELKDYNEDDTSMALFRTLYKDGDEDMRRAMMKSFSESGGQVLSTNWDEVKTKKVVYEGKD